MKYLITYSGAAKEERIFCENEGKAIELIENKLREGISEDAIGVDSLEQADFQVEWVPVVKLSGKPARENAVSNKQEAPEPSAATPSRVASEKENGEEDLFASE